jgi:hypothetical protein
MAEHPLDLGKQAKDIAEAANVSVDAVAKLGTFVDNTFGNAIKNGLGLIGDKLAYYRLERAIELQQKVEARLKAKGIDAKKYVPVSFGLPIFEKATVEENDDIQQLWANLLTNALDPKYTGKITRNFVSILADIEPIDARILDMIVREYQALSADNKSKTLFVLAKVSANTGIALSECENTVRNLMRLDLFKPGTVQGGMSFGGHTVSAYKDTEMFGVTGLGIAFHKAVVT